MSLGRVAIFSAATLISAACTHGGTLLTAFLQDGASMLAEVDPGTGSVTELGSMGENVQSMAYDSHNDVLYAVGNGGRDNLYRVNRTNGAMTAVGPVGISSVSGLAYDSFTDRLYGAGGLSTDHLLLIDRASGYGTRIGTASHGSSALEYLPQSHRLVFTTAPPANFGAFDPTNGSQSIVGPTGESKMYGMGYDPDTGILYGLAGNESDALHQLDPATDLATQIILLSRTEYYAAMAVVPSQDTTPVIHSIALQPDDTLVLEWNSLGPGWQYTVENCRVLNAPEWHQAEPTRHVCSSSQSVDNSCDTVDEYG